MEIVKIPFSVGFGLIVFLYVFLKEVKTGNSCKNLQALELEEIVLGFYSNIFVYIYYIRS